MDVRVRGIYATALTRRLLAAGHDVVAPSEPIRDRFDAEFASGVPDARVATTADRQGVTATGSGEAAASVAEACRDAAVDALSWRATAPQDGVFDARVTETLGRGAVCDLGSTEGFLPFDAADGYVEAGDRLRVQVRDPAPPWLDRRPELAEAIAVRAGPATLTLGGEGVTVDTHDEASGRELAGMLDLLDVAPPDGWGLVLNHGATDVPVETVGDAVEAAGERANTLLASLPEEVGEPGPVARPLDTRHVWFGRSARFALDADRRAVATTMVGHHRIKAGAESASAGVDFVEALCSDVEDGEFPFEVVTRQFGPLEGDVVAIEHGKPAGNLVTLGRGEVVERGADGALAVRREMSPGGTYDALGVAREAGDTALTKVREGRWWYPTVYRDSEGTSKGTYVNVCTPVECFPDAVRYVDLHVDVVKHADGRVERVDDDELDEAVAAGDVPEPLAERAREVASSIESAL